MLRLAKRPSEVVQISDHRKRSTSSQIGLIRCMMPSSDITCPSILAGLLWAATSGTFYGAFVEPASPI